ncbi:MAG: sensor histidine kinase [Ignavibacteria bacterium]|nr:MAG: sensor histidine kinase [Ignavibacteria bacterium]KAF0160742.1 MAG: sensor histidine kinase [Ignavibacteria bacterium]
MANNKHYMEDFVHANKLILLGKLTASLVHEIRNPLSAIKLNLDYMNMAKDDLPNDIQEIVGESLDAFDQVSFLIEDVLDFTRKPSAKIHEVDIDQVTNRCLKIISVSAKTKGVTIEKCIPLELPKLNVNKNKMMQVLLNLINNAIEASHDKGKIIVRAFEENEKHQPKVVWQVQDFGCGIKEEDKKKIIGKYFTTKSKGNGIGLGVCKMLTDEMNSDLSFDSNYGEGSTFTLKFTV